MAISSGEFNCIKDSLKEVEDSNRRNSAITRLISYGSTIVPQICSTLENQGFIEKKLIRTLN